ncbi:MAG: hypothetical protein Q8M24_11170 [Pseudolabrys sp.]|nr:hypothetical protein [Pseudolabrys sp.]MDP2296007.1 hypothetical protein [Pseudolabrys sp.]
MHESDSWKLKKAAKMAINAGIMTVCIRILVNGGKAAAVLLCAAGSILLPLQTEAQSVAATKSLAWTLAQLSPPPGDTSVAAEGWRLVRTPGPDKTDVVSIMRTADIMQSDAEFAGIMIRCRPKSGLQIAFAVITPFHPRSKPKITVGFNRSDMQFQADVIPPGSLIALPNEAEVLAKGIWQSAKELTVDIESEGAKIHGAVSLANLSAAVSQLQANCP